MSLVSAMRRGSRSDTAPLPAGTVTFLLTDVEASSVHWDADADRTDARLGELDAVLTRAVGANDGRLLKSRGEGDSAFAVFDRASAAVRAACAIQLAQTSAEGLSVRAAVHTGEARLRDGDYFGLTPNRTARLRSLAHGGQIVVSRVSADLAEPELPPDIDLFSLGSYRIRDWPRSMQVFGVRAPGLRSDFPPLRVLGDAEQAVMTIVCVDVAGSNASTHHMSDPEFVQVHRSLSSVIREAFDAHRGTFLKMTGDGCLAAFEHPLSAIAFAGAVARTTDSAIRVGAQTGIIELVGDDIIGRATYGAYTIQAHAAVGQLVTTATTVELLRGQGIEFERKDDDLFALDLVRRD